MLTLTGDGQPLKSASRVIHVISILLDQVSLAIVKPRCVQYG